MRNLRDACGNLSVGPPMPPAVCQDAAGPPKSPLWSPRWIPPWSPPPHCAVLSAFIDLLENSNEQVLIHDTRRTMKSMLSACLLCFFCSLVACFVALVFLRQAQYTGRKAVGKRQNSRW